VAVELVFSFFFEYFIFENNNSVLFVVVFNHVLVLSHTHTDAIYIVINVFLMFLVRTPFLVCFKHCK
jgi:hypothetical protein